MAVVVSSYLPGEAAAISRHPVRAVECVGDNDYYRGLASVWDSKHTLVNIEHDVEHNDDLIDGLLNCPAAACARPYLMYPRWREPYYCAANGPTGLIWYQFWLKATWVQPGIEWAFMASPGFIKVTADVRMPLGPECRWDGVEQLVNDAVNSRWHLHWPAVEHYHKPEN